MPYKTINMTSLNFSGENISLESVFSQHKKLIYDRVVEEISKNYKDETVESIHIIKITINNSENSVNLPREKFISGLENAIEYFVELEEYEKCQDCLNIINEIKSKKQEAIY